MKNRRLLTLALGICIAFSLSACGGGGDESAVTPSSMSYSGLATQVVIDSDNAEEITYNSYENGGMGKNIISASSLNTETPPAAALPLSTTLGNKLKDILTRTTKESSADTTASMTIAAAVSSYNETGTCGGTAAYNETTDEATGSFTVSITFNDYCTNGEAMNGSMMITGTMDQSFLQGTATFENLSVTLVATNESTTTTGNILYSLDLNTIDISMTINMLVQDNATNKVYKAENLLITISNMTSYSTNFSMSGKLYDPDYGYSVINTEQDFYLILSDNAPSDGIMVITGANGVSGGSTKARLSIIDQYSYHVEADTNGDGSYDYDSGVLYW